MDLNAEYGSNRVTCETDLPSLVVDGYDLSILGTRPAYTSDGTSDRIQDKCSSRDPARYTDPAQHTTSLDGAPLTSKMPMGRWGLRGTVVPRSTWFGGSQGWNPYKPPTNNVIVDPGTARAFTIDLSRVSAESAKKAMDIVEKASGPVTDIEQLRTKQAAAFHVMAQMAPHVARQEMDDRGRPVAVKESAAVQFGVPQQPMQPVPQPPQPAPVAAQFGAPPQPTYQAPSAQYVPQVSPQAFGSPQYPPQGALYNPTTQQGLNPMAAFTQPPQPQAQGFQAPQAAQPAGIGPIPQYRVTFGYSQGNQEGLFHSVIVQNGPDGKAGIIVLGLDTQYTGPKFLPRAPQINAPGATENRFAVLVQGDSRVYLVEHTAIQFEHKGELLTHLLVVEEKPAGNYG